MNVNPAGSDRNVSFLNHVASFDSHFHPLSLLQRDSALSLLQRGTALPTESQPCSDRDRHDEIDRGWRDDDSGRAVLAVWSRIKPAEIRGSLKM